MQKVNLEFVIDQATDDRQTSPFALAVRGAIEVGVVVPSILRTNLTAAGFTIVNDTTTHAAYGFRATRVLDRALVLDQAGDLVAMGAAGDPAEALLHAALGWFRENALPDAEVPEGVAVAPVNANPA